jgi:hypothetical protein
MILIRRQYVVSRRFNQIDLNTFARLETYTIIELCSGMSDKTLRTLLQEVRVPVKSRFLG